MTTCQHCQTELTSKRAKNCDECNRIKSEANKLGVYRAAVEALDGAHESGLTGTAVHEAARSAMQAELERQAAANRRQREDEKKRLAVRGERERVNALLRQHGYKWHKEDEESMDNLGANAFSDMYGNVSHVWILIAPDGREVSVKQALKEIESK